MRGFTPKPIVKWAGGKSRLLPELRVRMPTRIETYAEPFAGGAALFFALAAEQGTGGRHHQARSYRRAILADRNEDLLACYRAVRDQVEALIEALAAYRYDEELFYTTRDLDPAKMSDVERGARLIFLNRTCYNGLWRVNARGKFNVPFGRYTNPRILDADALRIASHALENVDLRVADFTEITRELGPGDFVYFDPPYVPVSDTADFTSYASGGFGPADQKRLANELRTLRDRGVMAMLSNADTPEARDLYVDFAVHIVRAPRMINSNASKRGDTNEVLVQSWGEPGIYEEGRRRGSRKRASGSE